jgi:hypothetical protein
VGAHRPATAVLTRTQRDVVFEQIEFAFESAHDLSFMLEHSAESRWDRTYALELIWQLGVAARMLEQLGWERRGTRERYLLEVDADVDRFVAQIQRYALAALEDSRRGLLETDDETQAIARRLIDVDLDALEAARTVRSVFRFGPAGEQTLAEQRAEQR